MGRSLRYLKLKSRILNQILSIRLLRPKDCRRMLKLFGIDMASRVTVYPGLNFIGQSDLVTFGRDVFINSNVTFGAGERIVLEEGVFVGPGCSFLPTTHEIGGPERRAGAVISK